MVNLLIFGTSAAFQWLQIFRHHHERREYGPRFVLLLGSVAAVSTYFAAASIVILTHGDMTFFSGIYLIIAIWSLGVATAVQAYNIHHVVYLRQENRAAREREEVLRRLHDELQREVISIISHELRTPLAVLQGYFQLLASGETYGPLTEEQRQGFSLAAVGLDRLNYLVNREIEVRRPLETSSFDVRDVISDVVDDPKTWLTTRRRRADNNIHLIFDELSIPPIVIESDMDKVRVIIAELIVNAIKFSDPGDKIIIGAYLENESFVFYVEDEGIGIDLEAHGDLIWRPGTQIRGSYMIRKHEGVGNGLAVVKALVDALGGRVEVESELDVGSTFKVTLPR